MARSWRGHVSACRPPAVPRCPGQGSPQRRKDDVARHVANPVALRTNPVFLDERSLALVRPRVSNAVDQFLLRELTFPGATFTKRIDQGQRLIENWISQGRGGNGLVQGFKSDATARAFGKGPHGGEGGGRL